MRIVVAKPDFRITGGFELVLARLTAALGARGHDVGVRTVDAWPATLDPYGLVLQPETVAAAPEFFRYLCLNEAFQRLDVSDADVVISTQPPSFAVRHPRQLALFFHHLRIYYDLSEAYVASGFVDDPEVHAAAEAAVRDVDTASFSGVSWFLAGSHEVRRRLERFNGIAGNVGVYLAGIAFRQDGAASTGGTEGGHVLCVSRHEWPKRTELFVEAMKHLPKLEGVMVGGGGRLPWVQTLDARLARQPLDAVDSTALWQNRGEIGRPEKATRSNVRFTGHVGAAALDRLFSEALCVVAPAYLEDYGLTAIEAMAYGKPVVVCRDGGGLCDTVADGETGLVVEPTGAAIAAAVARLATEPGLARRMGSAARDAAAEYTWDRALRQLEEGLERVMAA